MQVYSEAATASSLLFIIVVAVFIEMISAMLFIKQEECIIIALPMIELSLKYFG